MIPGWGSNIRREPISEDTQAAEVDVYSLVITGTKAQELLANDTFIATVNELTAQISDAILNTPIAEVQTRQNLYMLYKALENIVAILKASSSTKELVSDQLGEVDEDVDLTNTPTED